MRDYNSLYYCCWIIERFRRIYGMTHRNVISLWGENKINWILQTADILHCENPNDIINELSYDYNLKVPEDAMLKLLTPIRPTFDNIAESCAHTLALDSEIVTGYDIVEFYNSFLPPMLIEYWRELWWAPMHYLKQCYKAGKLI